MNEEKINEVFTALLTKLISDKFDELTKGDEPGHPFRGNQYTDGEGGGNPDKDPERRAMMTAFGLNPDLPEHPADRAARTPSPESTAERFAREKAQETSVVRASSKEEHERLNAAGIVHEWSGSGGQTAAPSGGLRTFTSQRLGEVTVPGATEGGTPARQVGTGAPRPISQIAREIRRKWSNVNFAAKPYLDAMHQLEDSSSQYGADDAESVVSRFLGNASAFRGQDAKRLKDELRAHIRMRSGRKVDDATFEETLDDAITSIVEKAVADIKA